MTGSESTQQLRLSSAMRGSFIAVVIALYGYVLGHPGASFTVSLLIAAGLQLGVLLLRRFVWPEVLPQAQYVLEMIVDGVTVFLFALGVYGGLLSHGLAI